MRLRQLLVRGRESYYFEPLEALLPLNLVLQMEAAISNASSRTKPNSFATTTEGISAIARSASSATLRWRQPKYASVQEMLSNAKSTRPTPSCRTRCRCSQLLRLSHSAAPLRYFRPQRHTNHAGASCRQTCALP